MLWESCPGDAARAKKFICGLVGDLVNWWTCLSEVFAERELMRADVGEFERSLQIRRFYEANDTTWRTWDDEGGDHEGARRRGRAATASCRTPWGRRRPAQGGRRARPNAQQPHSARGTAPAFRRPFASFESAATFRRRLISPHRRRGFVPGHAGGPGFPAACAQQLRPGRV